MRSLRPVLSWLLALLVAVLVTEQAPLHAQRFKWWQAEQVQRELELTPEQVSRLEEIFQSTLPTLRMQKQTLDEAEARFDLLLRKADDASVLAQVDVVEDARAALNKSRTLQLLNLRRVLTADQHAKLTAIQRGRERERNRGSRGGAH